MKGNEETGCFSSFFLCHSVFFLSPFGRVTKAERGTVGDLRLRPFLYGGTKTEGEVHSSATSASPLLYPASAAVKAGEEISANILSQGSVMNKIKMCPKMEIY